MCVFLEHCRRYVSDLDIVCVHLIVSRDVDDNKH